MKINRVVFSLCILSALLGHFAYAEDEEESATTKDPRISTETFALEPNANVSRKTKFTLLDESETKKLIFELWVEKKDKEGGEHSTADNTEEQEGA